MHFETVFDVAESGYRQWWFPAVGLIFVAIGTLFVFRPWLTPVPFFFNKRWRRRFAHSYLAFAVVWTLVAFVSSLGDYIGARNALTGGDFTVTEGVVTDFRFVPRRGDESFVVGGRRFSYSNYAVTAGFNHIRAEGGPIDDGIYVRITHRGNAILRLEIGRRD